jgi:hypothetical protein
VIVLLLVLPAPPGACQILPKTYGHAPESA